MATQDQILIALAPELASEDADTRALFLTLADKRTGTAYGDNRDQAVALLAAHMMTMRGRNGVGGVVTSEKEGDLSRTYAQTSSANPAPLSATSYGQQLLELRNGCIFGPRTTLDG